MQGSPSLYKLNIVHMDLKQRDGDLVGVLEKLNKKEKNEIAKVLKYDSFAELKNKYGVERDDLALEKEIRYAGSDWITDGVFSDDWATYGKIVRRVAKSVKAKYTDNTTAEDLEQRILRIIVDKAWEKMDEGKRREYEKTVCEFEDQMRAEDPEKLKELLEYLNVNSMRGMAPGVLLSAGMAFSFGGFLSYQILVIVMAAIGRTLGIKIAMNAVTKSAALFIPGLNIVMGVWMAWDVMRIISGPAMRKIVPVVPLLCMARIRQRRKARHGEAEPKGLLNATNGRCVKLEFLRKGIIMVSDKLKNAVENKVLETVVVKAGEVAGTIIGGQVGLSKPGGKLGGMVGRRTMKHAKKLFSDKKAEAPPSDCSAEQDPSMHGFIDKHKAK